MSLALPTPIQIYNATNKKGVCPLTINEGKKYIKAVELFDKHNAYTKEEAIDLVKKTSTSKFDGTVEIAFNLNVDPKKTDQQIRGAVVLPNGTGKSKRVLVLTTNADQKNAAKEAGAEFVGDDDLIEKMQKENWFDFDIIVATPEMMPSLGKLGKILGINRDEIIAIGDEENDLSMIKYAGLGVAMENAKEIVKQHANYITLSNDENGVGEVIKKFII